MDPSIVKLLEEDEDETMHSGADVEAFTAALNRDIEGDNTSTYQPPTGSDTGSALSQATTNHTPTQLFQQWKSSKREEEGKPQTKEHQSSAMEINRYASGLESQHPPNDTSRDTNQPNRPQEDASLQQSDPHNVHMSQATNMQNSDKNPAQNTGQTTEDESHLQRMQRLGNQQAMAAGQPANAMNRPAKQVPFALLLPVIEPQLDKDRAMQLQGLYVRLRSNNINKEEFVRHMRTLVGDHMLKMAVYKLQQGQLNAKPSNLPTDNNNNNPQRPRLMDDSHTIKQEREQPFPMQGLNKQHQQHPQQQQQQQQQQHMPFQPSSFPNYGNPSGSYSNPNMNMSSQAFKQQAHDLQMRQGPIPNAFNDMKRLHGGGLAHFTGGSGLQQNSGHWQPPMHKDQSHMSSMGFDQMNDQQHKSQMSAPQGPSSVSQGQMESSKDESFEMMSSRSITAQLERQSASAGNSALASGSNAKTPPKKPTVGQKKPLEAPASSLSKKPKVSGAFSDQSIEQLNDVTAVSGVNLREEEEQLFSGSKEDSRVSEASRKVVQEEEERLFLQKTPLQKKLAEIMGKCGVKNVSNDVERCLSLCVEERMRGLISNLIRLSKQRVDIEKPRHQTVVTSDVRKQIMSMNQKAREEWEKKQADAEKLQRADEPEGSGDGEDGRGKSFKVNKEEDDKMRTTAANVAARAAVGGDDMLSKWQLMAEQARQKREGGPDIGPSSQPNIDVGPKPVSTTERNSKDNPDTERPTSTSGAVTASNPGPVRKSMRIQELPKNGSIPRSITVKDVISVLGREIQMSRSTLIYRLYEKVRSDSVTE